MKPQGPTDVVGILSVGAVTVVFFFFLDAAWLNEGRCPGGRPSVSKNYIKVAKSMEILFLESNNVDQTKYAKHSNHDAVSQRVQGG